MSKNENCLEGMSCPQCGQADKILVAATIWVAVTDDGTDSDDDATKGMTGVDYDDESSAKCPACGFTGKWLNFSTDRQDLRYTCKHCGDRMLVHELRGHLESHNPNAQGFSWEDVLDQFDFEEATDGEED